MHAQQRGALVDLAVDQRQELALLALHAVGVGLPGLAGAERDITRAEAAHQPLATQAILDQVGDRAEVQLVLLGEALEIRAARHGAVVVHDLADHARWRATREPRQIDRALGVAGALQHTALHRAQREDVARADQVVRARVGRDGRQHGQRAIGSADARAHAVARLDGDGEGRGAVARCSRRPSCSGRACFTRSSVRVRQTRPRPYLAMKLTASALTLSAAITRSPSFSRSSSSTTITMRPARISSMARSILRIASVPTSMPRCSGRAIRLRVPLKLLEPRAGRTERTLDQHVVAKATLGGLSQREGLGHLQPRPGDGQWHG